MSGARPCCSHINDSSQCIISPSHPPSSPPPSLSSSHPPAPLFLSFCFFRLEFALFIPPFLKRSRAIGIDGWWIYEVGNLLSERECVCVLVGGGHLRTAAKSPVLPAARGHTHSIVLSLKDEKLINYCSDSRRA